jgi:PAS domain S-box-containing protein
MNADAHLFDERQRLVALRRYAVLDTAAEPIFDNLTALAAHVCGTPIAILSFIDENRVWFKSRVGVTAAETARATSFSTHAITESDLFVLPDATKDERFARSPSVIGPPGIRFYAGAPVMTAAGEAIGTLSVMDRVPRTLSASQQRDLRVLSRQVMAQLELRRRTLELEDHERLLATIIESEPECVKLIGPDGIVRLMNRAGLDMIEADSVDEIPGGRVFSLVSEEYREPFEALTERVLRGDRGMLEFQITGLKGGRRWLETSAVPLRDEHGTVSALLGITRDITERKRADAELRESEQKYRTLFEQATDGIFVNDVEGRFVDVNAAACRMTGYSRDELLRLGVADLLVPEERRRMAEEIARLSETATASSEWQAQRKDGTHYLAEVTAKLLPDGRVQSFVRDITERAELQMQFLQAQKMESVGRLAGGIAHDFNNLLTVINGLAELAIASIGENDPLRPDLHEIRLAGGRAARLTRQLLALSRQQVLKPEVINLSDLVTQMQEMLRRLIGEDVDLVFALRPDLGNVKADAGQIEQVVLNLTVNARDAMPRGGRLIVTTKNVELDAAFASVHPSVVPGPHVLLRVSDTGIGMDAATQKRIFEPFFTTKERGKGTGLGLSTVYGIVKQSGGTIWVSSNPGQGATFDVYLPQIASAPAMTLPVADGAPSGGTETILLVEDEPALRDLARRVLQRAGYTVLEAGSGEDAIEMLTRCENPLHLLVSDVVLTGMNGRELSERLRSAHPDLKVLFISGYADDALLHSAAVDDPRRLLMKPYTPAELKRRIREVLDG